MLLNGVQSDYVIFAPTSERQQILPESLSPYLLEKVHVLYQYKQVRGERENDMVTQ